MKDKEVRCQLCGKVLERPDDNLWAFLNPQEDLLVVPLETSVFNPSRFKAFCLELENEGWEKVYLCYPLDCY